MLRTLLPVLLLSVALAAPARAAPDAPVRAFQDVLIEAMKAGESLDFAGRSALIAGVVDEAFDLPGITRAVIGEHVEGLDAATRRALAERLREFAIAALAARFTEHDGERFVVGEVSDVGDKAKRVRASFERDGESPVRLDYLVREVDGAWRIANVWFEGVSQSRIQRDEFAAFLRDGRADALIERLDDRIATLAGG